MTVTAKRKKAEVKKEYSLVRVTQNRINDGRNAVNDGRNRVNEVDNTQSKVKESKVNNSAPAPLPELPEEDDDEGMDPMEALRLWREMEKNKE